MNDKKTKIRPAEESHAVLPDLTDPEEARKAFIASEVFNKKY